MIEVLDTPAPGTPAGGGHDRRADDVADLTDLGDLIGSALHAPANVARADAPRLDDLKQSIAEFDLKNGVTTLGRNRPVKPGAAAAQPPLADGQSNADAAALAEFGSGGGQLRGRSALHAGLGLMDRKLLGMIDAMAQFDAKSSADIGAGKKTDPRVAAMLTSLPDIR
jgi:hypothetical protein